METKNGIGIMFGIFIVALVGIIIFQAAAQQVGDATNLITLENTTINTPANGTAFIWTQYGSLTDVVVYNGTALVPATNYTIANNVVTNGALSVTLTPNASAEYRNPYDWNISATAAPTTYIKSGGGRAVAGLIAIFFALAIAVVVLYPTLRARFF